MFKLFQQQQFQQEAFRERRHLHDFDIWPWLKTTLRQGQEVLYLGMVSVCLYLLGKTKTGPPFFLIYNILLFLK